jgi:hypothetical protein
MGYRYDNQAKLHIIDKDAESQCRYIFDQFDFSKTSLSELVDEINAKGFRTHSGFQWVKSSLHYFLTNPFYHGEFEFRDKLWPGIHQPYYDKSRYDARCKRLSGLHVGKRKRKFEFNLARLLKCSCGGMYTGDFKKQKYVYYRHQCNKKNPIAYLREEEIMQKISDKFVSLEFMADAARKLEAELHQYARNGQTKDSGTTRSLNRQLATITRKQGRLLDLYAEAEIDKTTLLAKVEQLTVESEKLKSELHREAIPKTRILSEISKAVTQILQMPNIYHNTGSELQIKIIRQTVRELTLSPIDKSIKIVWQEPMNLLLEAMNFPDQTTNLVSSKSSSYAPGAGFEPATG